MSARSLNKQLKELGIQYKIRETWLLYQKYANKGYTKTKTHTDDKGTAHISTNWTQQGRLFIYEQLKEIGILPLIEQE